MQLTLINYCTLLFCLVFSDSISHGFDSSKFLGTSNIRPPNGNQQASPPFFPEAWIQRVKNGVAFDPSMRQYQGNPNVNRDGYFLNGYQEYVPNVLQQSQQALLNELATHQRVPGYIGHSLPILPIQTERPYNNVPVNQYKPNQNFERDLVNQQQPNLPRQYDWPNTYDITQSPIFTTLLKSRQNHVVNKPEIAFANEFTKRVPESYIPQIPSRPNTESIASNIFLNDHKIEFPIRTEEFKNPQVDPVTTKDRLLASASNPVETRIVRPNYNIHQWMSNPNTRNILSTTKPKKRYLVIHPNGTIEHVDKLETVTKDNPNYVLMQSGDVMRNPIQKSNDKISDLHKQPTASDSKITTLPIPEQNILSLPLNAKSPAPMEIVPTKKVTITSIPADLLSSPLIELVPTGNLTTIEKDSESPKNKTTQYNHFSISVKAPQGPMIDQLSSPPPIEIIPTNKVTTIEIIPDSLKNKTSLQNNNTNVVDKMHGQNNDSIPLTVNIQEPILKPLSKRPATATILINDTKPVEQAESIALKNTTSLPPTLSSSPQIDIVSTGKVETIKLNTESPKEQIPPQNNVTNIVKITPGHAKFENNSVNASLIMNVQDGTLKPSSFRPATTVIVNDSKPLVKPVLTVPNKQFTTQNEKVPAKEVTSIKASPESSKNKTTSVPNDVNNVTSITVPENTLTRNTTIIMKSNQTEEEKPTLLSKPKPIIIYGDNRTIKDEEQKQPLSSLALEPKPIIMYKTNVTNDPKSKSSSHKSESIHDVQNVTKETPVNIIPANVIPERKEAHEQKPNNTNHTHKEILINSLNHNSTNNISEVSSMSEEENFDISKVKSKEKPAIWFRTTDADFFDKLTEGKNDYDVVYFFQIHNEPRVESETTKTVYPNGTIVEEIIKTTWENEEGPPVVTKTTRLLNPEENSAKNT